MSTYKLNDSFFQTPNPTNSYWAGFLAADGTMYHRANGGINMMLELSSIDTDLIKQFLLDLDSNHIIRQRYKSSSFKDNKNEFTSLMSYIQIYKFTQCGLDLDKNYNIGPRKSLTLLPPTNLSLTNALAYIKGYIDGDGSLLIIQDKDANIPHLRIEISGTKELLEWINQIFKKVYSANLTKNKRIKLRPRQKIHYMTINGYQQTYEIGKILFNCVNRGLKRKWDKFQQIHDIYRSR